MPGSKSCNAGCVCGRHRAQTADVREKISKARMGHNHSQATKAKMSASKAGIVTHAWTTESLARLSKSHETHGLSKHAHYMRWYNMMSRCYDPKNAAYENYGGRGIKVCQEWQDVSRFISYLVSELGPVPAGCSMDRTDNEDDYRPGNLQWASHFDQVANRRPSNQWRNA